jgi:hypothetical protein
VANILPGQVINLNDADLAVLEKHIEREITNLETQYSEFFDKLKIWWRWYEAAPRMKAKNFPFQGASNIVVPLIHIMCKSLLARTLNTLFGAGDRVWMARTENEENTARARDMVRYMNWQANGNDFDLRMAAYDAFYEMYPIGSTVLALNWRDDQRFVYAPGRRNNVFSKSVAQPVSFGRGPIVESSPRETYLWDTAFNIGDAPIVVREMSYTWSQLNAFHQKQPKAWNEDALEAIKGEPGRDAPSKKVSDEKRKHGHIEESDLDQTSKPHDIREVHVDWPVIEAAGFSKRGAESLGTPSLPIVITQHRNTNKILQVKAEPYNLPSKPFFDFYYEKESGGGHGVGVAKRLEHMQSAMTTQLNQSIDTTTRGNAVWAITSSRKHMDSPLDPSHPIYAPGMLKEFAPFALSEATGPEQSNIQMVQVISERLMGIADPALGRETRQGGHPSPATSTLALLENTDTMSVPTMSMIRRQFSRMGEAIAILNQQFETNEDGKIQRVLGGVDGASVMEFLFPREPIPGNYQFDVAALSPQANPDAEMNRAIQVGQMNQLYWSQVIQGAQALESPQVGPLVKLAWQKYIHSTTNTYMRFLESSNVDEIEKFVLNLRESQQQGAQALGGIAGQPAVAGGGAGTPPQLPVGGAGGAAGGGTLALPGGIG